MASPCKSEDDRIEEIINEHESRGDINNLESAHKYLKNDHSENAMLRSRIEEQGQLICYLKQRADHQLKRLDTLEEINNELHVMRTQAQEESRERLQTCQMMERRFQELSENHEEMIKIKDEYKYQCRKLTVENKSLKDQIARNFSEAIEERDRTISGLKEKLSTSEERVKVLGKQNKNLQSDLTESSLLTTDKIRQFEIELDKEKKENATLEDEIKMLKQNQLQKSSRDNDSMNALKQQNERLLNEVMERGKLLQERQTDNDELKKEIENQEKKMETLLADFNEKQDLVNSNLRVQNLQSERDRLDAELKDFKRQFEAFRLHSNNLLEQEKELNSKLRNNVFIK